VAAAGAVAADAVKDTVEKSAAAQAAAQGNVVKDTATAAAADAVMETAEKDAAAEAGAQEGASPSAAAQQGAEGELIPTVKKLLGLPVSPNMQCLRQVGLLRTVPNSCRRVCVACSNFQCWLGVPLSCQASFRCCRWWAGPQDTYQAGHCMRAGQRRAIRLVTSDNFNTIL
jgi:hypothetical protein